MSFDAKHFNAMPITLYTHDMSPVCRSVYLTAAALDLKLQLIVIDVWKKEQFSEEFLKINPRHSVPVLDDEGTIICDSNAINIYLVSKYGKDDSLYPKDVKIQVVIIARLVCNAELLLPLIKKLVSKISHKNPLDGNDYAEVERTYKLLETYLETNPWMACNVLTIADFSVFSCVTSLMDFKLINAKRYPKLDKWIRNMEKLPYYHVLEKGMKECREYVVRKFRSPL